MNDHLQRQETAILQNRGLEEKASSQLEAINNNLIAQNQHLASFSEKKSPAKSQYMSLVWCACIAVIICFSFYTVQLYKTTKNLQDTINGLSRNMSIHNLGEKEPVHPGPTKEIDDKRLISERHIVRLDSIIAEQAQAIRELKLLNTTAVRTFIHIRRDLDRIHTNSLNAAHTDSVSSLVGK
jgi:flagellar biosynthesis chaperone FliJ